MWGFLAATFAFSGYAYRDPDISRAIDYRVTLLTAPGISSVTPSFATHAAISEPLPAHARYLFADSQKGPRADKFAYAMKNAGFDSIVTPHENRSAAFGRGDRGAEAALAGAELFLSAFAPRSEPMVPDDADAPVRQSNGEWAGLLKNASLSPDQPQTLFGGLTEDEFRARELRCMATAIYFEARDEPHKRPDRRRASYHEPHPQPLLSENYLRRRLSRRA